MFFIHRSRFNESSLTTEPAHKHTHRGKKEKKKLTLRACCRGNGLGNCLATGSGTTTCLPRYPLKVNMCVCAHMCVSGGASCSGIQTHTHTPSLSRCFSSLVSSPLCLALLLEVLICRHSANITTSHIKLGWVRRMIAIFVCPCVGGLCLVVCEWEEHICLCVDVCEGHAGSSSCKSFKGLRGRWSDLSPPPPGEEV